MDDAKKRILARRAKFVAAALAGVSSAAAAEACATSDPPPIVQVPLNDVDAASSTSTSNLKPAQGDHDITDASTSPSHTEDVSSPPPADTFPMPCLSPLPPQPQPQPQPTPTLTHFVPPPKPPTLPPKIRDGGSFRPCLLMLLVNPEDKD